MNMNIPPPNWGNLGMQTAAERRAVGDPRLWANSVITTVDNDPLLGNTPRVINGEQIILAQTADRYSRSWSLSGVVTAPDAAWNANGPAQIPLFPDPAGGGANTPLEVWLSVIQGLELITVEHVVLLMAGGSRGLNNAYGLCNQQASWNGGPYGATFTSSAAEQGQQQRAFAMIGALIGHTIAARAIYVRGGTGIIPNASVSLLLTPYNAGTGL